MSAAFMREQYLFQETKTIVPSHTRTYEKYFPFILIFIINNQEPYFRVVVLTYFNACNWRFIVIV